MCDSFKLELTLTLITTLKSLSIICNKALYIYGFCFHVKARNLVLRGCSIGSVLSDFVIRDKGMDLLPVGTLLGNTSMPGREFPGGRMGLWNY